MSNEKLKDLRFWQQELEKCKESPLYFYNNYVLHEGHRKLTQEEYDQRVSEITSARRIKLKFRNPAIYLLSNKEVKLIK